ncbi:MAG: ATP-binding protein, partial [Gemmatimonadota bacterium]
MSTELEGLAAPPTHSFLEGGGELGERMRNFDWASTPLGPVEHWPQSLRSAVSILLPSKAQIVLFWGPELITLYNDAYRPVFGAKHPGALGKPGREAWSELWDVGLSDLFRGVLTTGEAFWARDRQFVLERHGFPEETYFDVSYDPVRDESGNVGGVFCIVSETTGRVVGERRLQTLRDLAARNADARSPREACVLSADVLGSNGHDVPFALLYLGGTLEEAPVLQCGTPGSESIADIALWPWKEALGTNQLQFVTVRGMQPPTGAWTTAPSTGAVVPIPGTAGSCVGLLVAGLNPHRRCSDEDRGFLDLLVRQIANGIANGQAYEEERRRAEALADLDRAKTAFFSNVSHEFRTPLTLMLGPLEDTLAGSALADDDRARLELTYRNSTRLLKLVNTLLDFSRIEAGRIEASYEPVDLGRLTGELASVFRSVVERAGLELNVHTPSLGDPVYVDREMWEKIVFNLLSNAFKFTFEGAIEVSLARDGNEAVLVVHDSGSGIPAEDLPHLFERFYRVKGVSGRTFEGSGIGLALVQELARLHGGHVHVESTLGEGTRFSVRIPFGTDHLPKERIGATRELASTSTRAGVYVQELSGWLPKNAESPPNAATAPAGRTHPARILLADDNADMREYVQRLLGEHYEIEAVADGAAAMRAALARTPDLVLTDVMMPEVDGFELLRRMRADARLKSVPIIMLSARAGEESHVEGIIAGADDYLTKPFGAKELLARVEGRLQLSRLRSQLQAAHRELADLFAQTPVPTAVLSGPELVFEMVNPAYVEVSGNRELLGRPLLEALPE